MAALDSGETEKTPKKSTALDRAYIFDERYKKRESTFVNLKAKRYRFMATFRGDSHRPFEIIDGILDKLYIASNILGQYYWQVRSELPMPTSYFATDDQLAAFLKGMNEQEAVFYATGGPDDQITPVIGEAVRAVEAIADKAATEYATGLREWGRRWNAYADNVPDPDVNR